MQAPRARLGEFFNEKTAPPCWQTRLFVADAFDF